MSITLSIAAEMEKLGWTVRRENDRFHLVPGQHQVQEILGDGEVGEVGEVVGVQFFYVIGDGHSVCLYVAAGRPLLQTYNADSHLYEIVASKDAEDGIAIFRTMISAVRPAEQKLIEKLELNYKWVAALEAADIQIAIDPTSVKLS